MECSRLHRPSLDNRITAVKRRLISKFCGRRTRRAYYRDSRKLCHYNRINKFECGERKTRLRRCPFIAAASSFSRQHIRLTIPLTFQRRQDSGKNYRDYLRSRDGPVKRLLKRVVTSFHCFFLFYPLKTKGCSQFIKRRDPLCKQKRKNVRLGTVLKNSKFGLKQWSNQSVLMIKSLKPSSLLDHFVEIFVSLPFL